MSAKAKASRRSFEIPAPGDSAGDLFPAVADEWDFDKNDGLTLGHEARGSPHLPVAVP